MADNGHDRRPRRLLGLQSYVFLTLAPALLLVTIAMGVATYAMLYSEIMGGFERKLRATAITVGEFIDGEVHDSLYARRRVTGIAFDPRTGVLYGLDAGADGLRGASPGALAPALLRIDPVTGSADVVAPLPGIAPGTVGGLTFDPMRRRLFAVEERVAAPSVLLRIDPDTGRLFRVGPLSPPGRKKDANVILALAPEPETRQLLGAGKGGQVWRIDPDTGRVHSPRPGNDFAAIAHAAVTGLASDLRTGELWAALPEQRQVAHLGNWHRQGVQAGDLLQLTPQEGEEAEVLEGRIAAVALAFGAQRDGTLYAASRGLRRENETIKPDTAANSVDAADRLMTLLPAPSTSKLPAATATVHLADFVPGYRNEAGEEYTTYAQTLGRIRDDLDLTYLYTMVPREGKWIEYVVDPTQGDEHAPIGYPDDVSEEYALGARQVMAIGTVYIASDIHRYEKWGQLKSGAGPLFSHTRPDVSPRGMVGLDLNIAALRAKTALALARVGVVALLSLVIGALIAFAISRALTRPMGEIKEVALGIAAGRYGARTEVRQPVEMGRLGGTLNTLSATLAETVRALTEENEELDARRRFRDLIRELRNRGEAQERVPTEPANAAYEARLTLQRPAPDSGAAADASGAVFSSSGASALIWLADGPSDPVQALALRVDIGEIAARLLERQSGQSPAVLLEHLAPLYRDWAYCWTLADLQTGTLHTLARRPVYATLAPPAEDHTHIPRAADLSQEQTLALARGALVTFGRETSLTVTFARTLA